MDSELEDVIHKDAPITCFMCKSARKGGERLFMFGGNRPFMAKFEPKLVAFIGQGRLLELQNKYKTKRDRSYICKHCYSTVDKTFDNIKKIQHGIARSVRKVLSQDVAEDEECDSDIEWSFHLQANISKKKLPSVAERMAEKIASLTLVKINRRVPRIVVEPIVVRKHQQYSKKDDDIRSCVGGSESDDAKMALFGRINAENENALGTVLHTSQEEFSVNRPKDGTKSASTLKSQTENICTSEAFFSKASVSQIISTSVNVQQTVNKGTYDVECNSGDRKQINLTCDLLDDASFQDSSIDILNKDHLSCTKPSPAELSEILANPLLMVKSRQPIKLLDVKNENVYMCEEDGCDWIFSSRFFWENHIRHYHYYGKPHKCPFDGCKKYFSTKSKQKQHVRKHTGERPFVCEECGKAFRGSQELRHHRGSHTVGKPYQCPKSGCYKSFKYINSMKRHLQFHDGNYPFPCSYPKCAKAFKNKYELKCHNRLHTGERPYRCREPGCGKAFRLPCEYTKHRRAHTGERPFKCTWDGCSAAYVTCGGLANHMLSHSNDQHFCCEFCGKTFKHKMSYHSHLKQHTNPSDDFSCKIQDNRKIYSSRRQVPHHLTDLHGQRSLAEQKDICRSQLLLCNIPDCGKELFDRRLMDQHMTSSHDIQNYQPQAMKHKKVLCEEEEVANQHQTDEGLKNCKMPVHELASSENFSVAEKLTSRSLVCPFEKCEKRHKNYVHLHDHMAKVHSFMPIGKMCHLCGQAFPHIQQLELHMHGFYEETSVLNEHVKGIFVCNAERCGQSLPNADELKSHVFCHIINPPYKCEFENCRMTFLLEKAYSNHMQQHRNLKPHTCSFDGCQQGFATQLKLLKHSKTHYGCFRCPVNGCGKMLQAVNSARIHLFRHTGEKPYACTVCGMRFAACAQWIRHKRTHTGELPFMCTAEGCGKAFRESGSLKSHQNVHSKPNHLCSQCGKMYKFSIMKHKCKMELQESVNIQSLLSSSQSQVECVQPPVQQQEVQTQLSAQHQQQSLLPPPLCTVNNMAVMADPTSGLSSYMAQVEDAACPGKSDCNVQMVQDTVLMQDVDRNLMVSSPHYNYMILYDRPVPQGALLNNSHLQHL